MIILFLPAVLPHFIPYFLGTADGLGHRFRLYSFHKSLSQGILRPRWAAEAALGHGAPTFLFNYPLPYYIGSVFLFLGFQYITAAQLLAVFSLFFSAVFMYLFVKTLFEGSCRLPAPNRARSKFSLWRVLGLPELVPPLLNSYLKKFLYDTKFAGVVSAVVYLYAPYHLFMSYTYDAWGEVLAFIFPPLILYLSLLLKSSKTIIDTQNSKLKTQIYNSKLKTIVLFFDKLITDSRQLKIELLFVLLSLSWFLFLLSHNVTVVMFTPVILFLTLIIYRSWKGFLLPLAAFVFGVLTAAFFWMPAYSLQNEMNYPKFIAGESTMRGAFFKDFSFLFNTAFEAVKKGNTWYYDFTIGLPIILVLVTFIIFFIIRISPKIFALINSKRLSQKSKVKSQTDNSKFKNYDDILEIILPIIFSLMTVFSLYLVNYKSNWLWDLLFPLKYILYPFRYLFMASFTGAVLAGFLTLRIPAIGVFLVIFALIQGLPFTKTTVEVFPFANNYFVHPQTVSRVPLTKKNMLIKEFLPRKASEDFVVSEEDKISEDYYRTGILNYEEIVVDPAKGKVINQTVKSESMLMTLDIEENASVTLRRFAFPNWQIFIDGRKSDYATDGYGRMNLVLDKGRHTLELKFGYTTIEKVANIISLLGFLGMVGVGVWIKMKSKLKT